MTRETGISHPRWKAGEGRSSRSQNCVSWGRESDAPCGLDPACLLAWDPTHHGSFYTRCQSCSGAAFSRIGAGVSWEKRPLQLSQKQLPELVGTQWEVHCRVSTPLPGCRDARWCLQLIQGHVGRIPKERLPKERSIVLLIEWSETRQTFMCKCDWQIQSQ